MPFDPCFGDAMAERTLKELDAALQQAGLPSLADLRREGFTEGQIQTFLAGSKPLKSKSEVEALILARARTLGMALLVRDVKVRPLHTPIAGCNWIVIMDGVPHRRDRERHVALREILPPLRDQYDLREDS